MSELQTLDGIIGALYEALSYQGGAKPNYERLVDLFYPGAAILPPNDDDLVGGTLTVDELIELSREAHTKALGVSEEGFTEREVARTTNVFSTVAQVFSSFEAVSGDSRSRGVNALQLVFQAGRWWITALAWDDESPPSTGGA